MTTVNLYLAQTLTNPETSRQLDELHRKYGFGDSRLLKVRNYLHFLKEEAPEAIWGHSTTLHDNCFCEIWNILHGKYTYNLMVTSYKATHSPTCGVHNPDTPKAAARLLTHIRSAVPENNKLSVVRLFSTVFNSHSADCVYAIDQDEQEWSMVMHDNRNHTRVLLEIFKSQ